MKINNFKKKLICVGAGDQFEAIKPIIESLGSKVDFLIDDTPNKVSPYENIEFIGARDNFERWFQGRIASDYGFVIAIGNPHGQKRIEFSTWLKSFGIEPVSFADTTSHIEKNSKWGEGLQAMKYSILSTLTNTGVQCILNTRSLVEHHCILGDAVEVGPGATLCGRVKILNYTWIGAGSTILPRLTVDENCIVGAGAVVTKNIIEKNTIWVGSPAKYLKDNIKMK